MMDICKCREVRGTRLQTGIPTSPAMLWVTQLFPLKTACGLAVLGSRGFRGVYAEGSLLPTLTYQVVCYPT